jgi:hypothetical protein
MPFCMGLNGSVNFDDDALPLLTRSLGCCLGSREWESMFCNQMTWSGSVEYTPLHETIWVVVDKAVRRRDGAQRGVASVFVCSTQLYACNSTWISMFRLCIVLYKCNTMSHLWNLEMAHRCDSGTPSLKRPSSAWAPMIHLTGRKIAVRERNCYLAITRNYTIHVGYGLD